MYKRIIGLFCLTVCVWGGLNVFAQDISTSGGDVLSVPYGKVPVHMGVYVTSLSDFDYLERSFGAKAWYWYTYDQDVDIEPELYTEFVNAKSVELDPLSIEYKGGKKRVVGLVQGTFQHNRDPKVFPFDKQLLQIPIENKIYDMSIMHIAIDETKPVLQSDSTFGDWVLLESSIEKGLQVYRSNFGDPILKEPSVTFEQVTASFLFQRETPILLFVKIFFASYLAVLAIYLSHLIPQDQVSARFGMSTAALFAALSNSYVINNHIPHVSSFTLVDGIQLLIIVFIILSVIFTILSTIEYEQGDTRDPWDRWFLRYAMVIFVIANVIFLYYMWAMYH